jgi:23S rRNA pseudouridine1911/1915/1917 synthase
MTTIKHQFTIPEALNNTRLDQALAKLLPDYSRSQIQQWIKEGAVQIDQTLCQTPKTKIKTDQTLDLHANITPQERWQAQAIPLNIIYQDDDLIVINKPAGLVVHPGAGNPDQTLVNALLHHFPELDELPRAGIIHRLDKDTSGLLVIARNLKSHHALVQAMQARDIKREYVTMVNGTIIAGNTIETDIGRHPVHRTKMAVVNHGKPAITHYRVIERFPQHTYLRVILETGRTHQIRVHLAHIHHPIVGDPIYGKRNYIPPKCSEELREFLQHFKRQALHAQQLELAHPASGEILQFEAPLPDDISSLINLLKQHSEK